MGFDVSTGIEERSPEHRVYPNPVLDEIFIDLDLPSAENQEVVFELFDLTGKGVFMERCSISENRFQLSGRGLSDGIYLYRIYGPEQGAVLFTGKVILRLTNR